MDIAVIPLQQRAKIPHPAFEILPRVHGISHAKPLCRPRSQLHQSQRSLTRDRDGVPIRFGLDDRTNQSWINSVPLSRLENYPLKSLNLVSPGHAGAPAR